MSHLPANSPTSLQSGYSYSLTSSNPPGTKREFVLDCTNQQNSRMYEYNTLNDKYLECRVIHFRNLKKVKDKLIENSKGNHRQKKSSNAILSNDLEKSKENVVQSRQSDLKFPNVDDVTRTYARELGKRQFDEFIRKKKEIVERKLMATRKRGREQVVLQPISQKENYLAGNE